MTVVTALRQSPTRSSRRRWRTSTTFTGLKTLVLRMSPTERLLCSLTALPSS